MVDTGRDLWRSRPTQLLKQGHREHIAQEHIQLGFEDLGDSTMSLGNLFQCSVIWYMLFLIDTFQRWDTFLTHEEGFFFALEDLSTVEVYLIIATILKNTITFNTQKYFKWFTFFLMSLQMDEILPSCKQAECL